MVEVQNVFLYSAPSPKLKSSWCYYIYIFLYVYNGYSNNSSSCTYISRRRQRTHALLAEQETGVAHDVMI